MVRRREKGGAEKRKRGWGEEKKGCGEEKNGVRRREIVYFGATVERMIFLFMGTCNGSEVKVVVINY